jgi:hypothetical protein
MKTEIRRTTIIERRLLLDLDDLRALFGQHGLEIGRDDMLYLSIKEGDLEHELRRTAAATATLVLTLRRTTKREEK